MKIALIVLFAWIFVEIYEEKYTKYKE